MYCISITDYKYDDCVKSVKKCEKLLKKYPDLIAEIRLDLCNLSETEVRQLFLEAKVPLIAVCRKSTKHLAEAAVQSGAQYIDVDVLSSDSMFQALAPTLKKRNLKKIFSFHNYTSTPQISELKDVCRRAVKRGADIIKICTQANTIQDAERVMQLYELHRKGEFGTGTQLIAFTMGSVGRYTRLEALNIGAPFMYCTMSAGDKWNIGQFSYLQMEKFGAGYKIEGEITIPASKSVAQRAIVAASLAKGESEFQNLSRCDDIDYALGVAKQIGAGIDVLGDTVTIHSKGFKEFSKQASTMHPMFAAPIITPNTINLFVGESGLLSRLCIPIAAQLGEGVTITGAGTLLRREMYGCKESLEEFEAKCILTAENTLPAVVSGPLSGGKVTISGKKGSQLISGLLMALPLSKKNSTLTVTNATSLPYIKLTLDVVSKFGIEISCEETDSNLVFNIPGKQSYSPASFAIEGDWSSASNFIVAGALFGDISIKGLDMNSHQADRAIVDIIRNCGGYIMENNGCLRIKASHLKAFEYDATNSPDLFPVLAILAAFCEGESSIKGVDRLRTKESDRKESIMETLRNMGVKAEVEDGTMYIEGISYARRVVEGKNIAKGTYKSFNDHRIAMAVHLASLGTPEKVCVDRTECINKSFPQFLTIFNSLKVK
jgi:3-phosphoshikimate 1-carboxyvinyltransferase